MKQITAEEFKTAIALDLAWAARLTEPVEITNYCDMSNSLISRLSPLLHFTGTDVNGNAASFNSCRNLEVAEGTFHGWVGFKRAAIKTIGELTITRPNWGGNAADFSDCPNLEIAEGTFPGHVNFYKSNVARIGKLVISAPNANDGAANFYQCANLEIAEGTFPGWVCFESSGIEKIGELVITKQNSAGCAATFHNCDNLKTIPAKFLGPEYGMSDAIRQKNRGRIAIAKTHRDAPDLEI